MKSEELNVNIEASVVIPTYDRANILKRTLERLFTQTYPPDKYEIIVVDDGSTDNTEKMVRSLRAPCSLIYLKQDKKGASAARNYGIRKARGEIIIFVDSDIFVNRKFVEEHIRYQKKYKDIIVRGVVIHTANINDPTHEKMKLKDISTAFFATGNVSIRKKHLLRAGLFDEDFTEYGWEDLELGIRLKRQGMKVKTNKMAIGYHYSRRPSLRDLPDICAKEKMRGRTAVLFYRKHPTFEVRCMTHISPVFFILDRFLNWNDWTNKKCGRDLLLWLEKHNSRLLLPFLMKIISSHFYIKGIKEALNKEL